MTFDLSAEAREDLLEIYDHSLEVWGDEQADRYLSGLYTAFAACASKPLAGRQRSELGNNTRSRIYKSHLIIYVLRNDGVAISRVLHQARDISEEFLRPS